MSVRRIAATLAPTLLALLAACAGGGSSPAQPVAPAPTPTVTATASAAPTTLVATSFAIGLASGSTPSSTARSPRFIGAGGKSATVTLTATTANGGTIPSGLTTSVTSTITVPCPCSVAGPNVPPGQDTFTFTVYDAVNGTGNVIATYSATYAIAAGVANTNTVTLNGMPAAATIAGVPSLPSGTATSAPLTVTVSDADANTISGTYAVPITVSTNDTAGIFGQQLAVNGGTPAPSVTVTKSTDVVTLAYGGLTESPKTLAASRPGPVTIGTAAVATTNAPIVYNGPLNGTTPEIDLYAPTGVGSSGTLGLTQTGFTNAPFAMAYSAVPNAACASIATVSPSAGTTFTVTALAAPVAGSCSISFVNQVSGQSQAVVVTYTSAQTGIQGEHRSSP